MGCVTLVLSYCVPVCHSASGRTYTLLAHLRTGYQRVCTVYTFAPGSRDACAFMLPLLHAAHS